MVKKYSVKSTILFVLIFFFIGSTFSFIIFRSNINSNKISPQIDNNVILNSATLIKSASVIPTSQISELDQKVFDFVMNLFDKYSEVKAFQDTAAEFSLSVKEVEDIWYKVELNRMTQGKNNQTQWENGKAEIERMIRDTFEDMTNTGKKKIKAIIILPVDIDNTNYSIQIKFNADDNAFGNSAIKDGIYKDMTDLYKALYTSKFDIKLVMNDAYFDLSDNYGNENEVLIYGTRLYKEEAIKVNWKAEDTHLSYTIMPAVWEVTEDHFNGK